MFRSIIEELARKVIEHYDNKDRKEFLKSSGEAIHIADGFSLMCGRGSVYIYEEYDWSYTPYVHNYNKDEIKYASCKNCLRAYERIKSKG